MTFQPYPVSLLKKCVSEGGNTLGLDPADGPLVSVLLLTRWKDAKDDDKIVEAFRGLLEAVDRDAASRGTAVPFKYINYAQGLPGPHRLLWRREQAQRYDPEGLFQKGVPGGFKLPV